MEAFDSGGVAFNVVAGGEEAIDSFANGVRAGGRAKGQDGSCAGHGVEEGAAEVGGAMRHDEDMAAGDGMVHIGPRGKRSRELDLPVEIEAAGEGLQFTGLLTRAIQNRVDANAASAEQMDGPKKQIETLQPLVAAGGHQG